MELSHKTSNLKISKGIGILTKLRRYLSKNVLRTLFYALVQPHIDYGLLVWGSATLFKKICKKQ